MNAMTTASTPAYYEVELHTADQGVTINGFDESGSLVAVDMLESIKGAGAALADMANMTVDQFRESYNTIIKGTWCRFDKK